MFLDKTQKYVQMLLAIILQFLHFFLMSLYCLATEAHLRLKGQEEWNKSWITVSAHVQTSHNS